MREQADDLDERFAAFVRGHGERHLRLAVLLTGDWHAAEDLVQASLVKVYQAWPRLETDADPDAYLRRIVVNTHRSWWRARWRRENPVAALPDGTCAQDMADTHAIGTLVRQALARLQPPRRTCSRSSSRPARLTARAARPGTAGPAPATRSPPGSRSARAGAASPP
jgi:DNA-directed RNA polymerase specialized sigma24 family protein